MVVLVRIERDSDILDQRGRALAHRYMPFGPGVRVVAPIKHNARDEPIHLASQLALLL